MSESSPPNSEQKKAVRVFTFLGFPAALLALCGLIVSLALYLAGELGVMLDTGTIGSNLEFFLLFQLYIFILAIIAYLVIKNLIKLALDRRRNILGSKLRLRLVFGFIGLSMVPTVLLFLVSKGLLSTVLSDWFSPQVEAAVEGAKQLTELYVRETQNELEREASELVSFLQSRARSEQFLDISPGGEAIDPVTAVVLSRRRSEFDALEVSIFRDDSSLVFRDMQEVKQRKVVPPPSKAAVYSAILGKKIVRVEQSLSGEVLRAYVPLTLDYYPVVGSVLPGRLHQEGSRGFPQNKRYVLVVSEILADDISQVLTDILDAHDDYLELSSYRRPLASSYLLALVVVTLMIVFAAIWIGLYLARSITGPIQLLAAGTEQIARGNLSHRIPEVGDDELSLLVTSFNQMTGDLSKARDELVAGRSYMEAILANVGVGVLSVDVRKKIRTINLAASSILNIPDAWAVIGSRIHAAFDSGFADQLEQGLRDLSEREERVTSFTTTITGHVTRHVQVTLSRLTEESGRTIGAVVLLDDLTELVNAQRVAAWREVARRIAHEIKNPLTPIQLSAQRILRKTSDDDVDGVTMRACRVVVRECAETIVTQVQSIKGLVDEFYRFARMPRSRPELADIHLVIRECFTLYQGSHRNIRFDLQLADNVPKLRHDPAQIRRAMVNLLDNAVQAILDKVEQPAEITGTESGEAIGQVSISTKLLEEVGVLSIEVGDDGPGVGEKEKEHIFEPYFSTKRRGTGLGLAIVNSIAADHDGFVRVRDNLPHGAVFCIELPIRMN